VSDADQPTVTLEGGRVRVDVDGKSYLLQLPNEVAFRKAYALALATVSAHFTPERTRSAGLQDDHAGRMNREIAMHWLYQYIVNRAPIQLTAADLAHSATRRILYASALAQAGERARAASIAAQLAGMNAEPFDRWLDADLRKKNR
jgi:hypothetical protein